MSKLESALALAAKGFKVFPITPNRKAPPLLKDWPEKATPEREYIEAWWTQWPDANIGIHCDGMIVLDVDTAKGGLDSFKLLKDTYGLPSTLAHSTPSGGHHVFYRCDAQVRNSVSDVGRGIDIRSKNGYVVAPGSTTAAGDYRVEIDLPITDAPVWLVERCGTAPAARERGVAAAVSDADASVYERAMEWLKTAERSVKGEGGDQAAYRVACRLRELGVSEAQCAELMRSDAWDHGCGWRDGWLEQKPIRSAYRYAQNEAGAAAAAPSDFPVILSGKDPQIPDKKTTAQRLSAFATSVAKGPGYLVKGLLQRRSYAELYGAPGEGKTFIALDIGYHVAAGTSWMGHKVHSGAVLYLAYEGTGGMVKRAQALRQRYGDADVPLYVAGAAINLREPAGRRELGGLIAELPEKPVLIVIDTFARALMGGDENSAQDVGAFNQSVAALIESTGACVMIIHHSGKNKSAGARGSSALLGAIDTELEVDDFRVTARKQRDVEAGDPVGFKLTPLVVGIDEDGDELTSCVVEQDTIVAHKGRLSGNAKSGFDVLCEIRPDNKPVTGNEWQEACKEFLGQNRVAQRFYEIKKVLRQKGYIKVDSEGLITRSMT